MLYFALAHRENVSANLEECSCNPWEKITTQFIIFLFVADGKSVRTKSFRFFSPRSRKRKSDDSVKVIACVLIRILKSSSKVVVV